MAQTELSALANPIISSSQLEISASRLDGIPRPTEDSIRYGISRLMQAAGILLRLPQEITAQSIVLLQRFYSGPDGGSMIEHDPIDVAAATLFLAAKPTGHSLSPRSVLTVFSGLATDWPLSSSKSPAAILTEGEYEARRDRIYRIESQILRGLGFQTHVALPYALCINHLQALNAFQYRDEGERLTKRAFAHINAALFSPQLLFLTHQPSAIATACIYLAAREVDVKLPEVEWWEVADVDREELGFLVVSLKSVPRFARAEEDHSRPLLTVSDIRAELDQSSPHTPIT